MIYSADDLGDAYKAIQDRALGSGPVLIFVSPLCDSVCAAHILTTMFRADSIPYKVKPVCTFHDLQQFNESYEKENDGDGLRSVVFINCGGNIEISDLMNNLGAGTTLFLVDSHRPYNLQNVETSDERVIILDASGKEVSFPNPHETEELDQYSSDDGDGFFGRPRKRQKLDAPQRDDPEYYSRHTYYGEPAATVLYEMARRLGKDDNNMLWCAIVGLTDHLIHHRMTRMQYLEDMEQFREQVFVSNIPDGAVPDQSDLENQVELVEDGYIAFEEREYAFYLYRHWSLFDSMFHARHLSARLGTWCEAGRKKLNVFLAKVGIPLKEGHAPFNFMSKHCKDRLKTSLMEHAADFSLDSQDLVFPSFARHYRNDMIVSAADMVYAVSGLLEGRVDDRHLSWEERIWDAHESLRMNSKVLLQRGINMAIELQRSIVQTAHPLLSRRAVRTTGEFRFCKFDTAADTLFMQPLALYKLGLFIMDSHETLIEIARKKVNRKESRKLPFLMCAAIPRRNTYLVVAIARERNSPKEVHNKFAMAFHEAAQLINAAFRQNWFEQAMIEIDKEKLSQFLDMVGKRVRY